ncbi:MAG TPA: hypothetical protein VLX91_08430 [Candidatus Acidoferrales bacterium]|nr:hypothetical protein [Candidatus Acidoferrales bacterium]
MDTGQTLAPLAALLIPAVVILSASGIILNQADVVTRCVTRITAAGQATPNKIIVRAFEDKVLSPLITDSVSALTPPLLRWHNMHYRVNPMILKGERDDF